MIIVPNNILPKSFPDGMTAQEALVCIGGDFYYFISRSERDNYYAKFKQSVIEEPVILGVVKDEGISAKELIQRMLFQLNSQGFRFNDNELLIELNNYKP